MPRCADSETSCADGCHDLLFDAGNCGFCRQRLPGWTHLQQQRMQAASENGNSNLFGMTTSGYPHAFKSCRFNHYRVTTAILGGGLSGLTLARLLYERGEEVLVLEAEPKIGGLCRSVRKKGLPLIPVDRISSFQKMLKSFPSCAG